MEGLAYNVGVGVGFIHSWLGGRGTFLYRKDVLPTLSTKFRLPLQKIKTLAKNTTQYHTFKKVQETKETYSLCRLHVN
jgi:hypothetical protein